MSENNNGANLGFENQMWAAADKLRGHMDASEYKNVVLGLIFLKYISDAFQAKYKQLEATKDTGWPVAGPLQNRSGERHAELHEGSDRAARRCRQRS
ncbi:MAG: type I restriction-modification system subunit M N-terminal domain-containing protein [Desulfobacterales bacterium]